ncbi:mitochondrial inner membrane protein required for protein import [Ascosphaera pollenicola]|nr:mitochondrial inner membrane protein required for protein import [Ascosphaera pollenicola]
MQSLRALRPQVGLRATQNGAPPLLRFSLPAVRHKHNMPVLANAAKWEKDGIKDFMTADGFHFAWTEHQSWLVENVNRLTEGTIYENQEVKDIAIETARNPNLAQLFNFASMAANNHFFFSTISDEPKLVDRFTDVIEETCSSVDSLKEEFLGTAEVMFGPGFVWLCRETATGKLKIVNTYNAGTPYAGAHFRRQGVDANTERAENLPVSASVNPLHKTPHSDSNIYTPAPWFKNHRYSSAAARGDLLAPGGVKLAPILCVNTWQTVWLPDYGLRNKRLYLEKWWERINWEVVMKNYGSMPDRGGTVASFHDFGRS